MTSVALAGIFRSLRIYRRDPVRAAAMDRLYARYIGPGDLAFDVGAHVGDRVASFRRLGASVVAVEPQPLCQRVLRRLHGRDPQVSIVPSVVGAATGRTTFYVNRANPTVSTASHAFISASTGAVGWEGQQWDDRIEVEVVTLDQLIGQHGVPAFVKIDVEGHESEVLRGLHHGVRALSFEFTTIQREAAGKCIARLHELGDYRFDAALGESQRLEFGTPVDAGRIANWLADLPDEANSGDVYATLVRAMP